MFIKIIIINQFNTYHIIHALLLREVIHDAALLAAQDKLLRFVVIRQCVYVTFYIKHHVALPLIITAPRMRLDQST